MKIISEQKWAFTQNTIDAIILFFIAICVRMLFFPYFYNLLPGGDEKDYWNFALTVASGEIPLKFYHPPLWGYLLASRIHRHSWPCWGWRWFRGIYSAA